LFALLAFFLIHSTAFAACSVKNQILLQNFFRLADVQYENMTQRSDLSDALRQFGNHPQSIRLARFSDYMHRPKRWSFIQIMDHYFVPSVSTFLNSSNEVATVGVLIAAAQCRDGRKAILNRVETLPIP
jgi:hypothetical protein